MNKKELRLAVAILLLSILAYNGIARPLNKFLKVKTPVDTLLDAYNVSWDTPGPGSGQSMPLGNGDIGLNVWVERNGDLVFYISKTDAWGGELDAQKDDWMKQGGVLMKLGAMRISISPNPLINSSVFKQILKLKNGEILVQEGQGSSAVNFRVWVDANHPVIRVETKSAYSATVNIKLENWRAGLTDTVLTSQKDRIVWYHHNSATTDPHLANLTFGAIINGNGLVNRDDVTMQSAKAVNSQLISIYPLTAVAGSGKQWLDNLEPQVNQLKNLSWSKHAWHISNGGGNSGSVAGYLYMGMNWLIKLHKAMFCSALSQHAPAEEHIR